MATIASLGVSLTARISDFQKGFKQAQRIVKKFAGDIPAIASTIASRGAAIAAAAGTAAGYLVEKQMESIDSTNKLRRTLGLTAEQMVGYQHAASLAGSDSEGFTKAVKKMNTLIAQAGDGSKTAQTELARVGLTIQQLGRLSTDDRIKLIADRYNSIGNAASRTAFLVGVFGREGLSIGNMFEEGAKGIEEAQKEAKALGLTFSDLDGANVEASNDAMTRLGASITGVARNIAVQLAPFIQAAAEYMTNFTKQGIVGGGFVREVLGSIAKAVSVVANYINLLTIGWKANVFFFSNMASAFLQVLRLMAKGWNNLMEFFGFSGKRIFENFLTDKINSLTNTAIDAFGDAKAAAERFNDEIDGKKVLEYWEIWQKAADANSKANALKLPKKSKEAGALSTKVGEFKQIDRSLVTIGSQSSRGEKPPTAKQTDTIINRLDQIASNTRRGAVLV